MRTLIRGGTVVGLGRADVLIDGEKIAAVGEICDTDATVIDASGKLIFPGFIDAHTHFDLPVSGTVTADDFYSGTRAALQGGTTTVIDFACPNEQESLRSALKRWHEKAGNAACDYGFHMTIRSWNPLIMGELPHIIEAGITSFKMYMAYPDLMLNEAELLKALTEIRLLGGISAVHCEDEDNIKARVKALHEEAPNSPLSHLISRPSSAESDAIRQLGELAIQAKAPIIIVHLSSDAGLKMAQAARREGALVYIETCPHYLLLDGTVFAPDSAESANFVCSPPLRTDGDSNALWEALKNGEIQTIATDHCSFTPEQKRLGKDDFRKIPGGLPSVRERAILIYSEGVVKNRLTAEQMCKLLAENPAKLYGLYGQKGAVAPGFDADLVILDPEGETVISAADSECRAGFSPYEGMRLSGKIDCVFLRGELAARDGTVIAGQGRFLKRGKNTL